VVFGLAQTPQLLVMSVPLVSSGRVVVFGLAQTPQLLVMSVPLVSSGRVVVFGWVRRPSCWSWLILSEVVPMVL
jgi:hypothetical protein